MRKTKIICTLGPSTSTLEQIKDLISAGMNVARFNFSHGTHEEQLARLKVLEQARTELGLPIGALLDTKGPEIRLRDFKNGKVTLSSGSSFTLCHDDEIEGDETKVAITHKNLYSDVSVGSRILLDDGLIELKVNEILNKNIVCTVINGGDISNKKGVNVPGVRLSLPFVSEKDRDDIIFGVKNGFDFIAASFTRCAEDILEIKKILDKENCQFIKIIAKIENAEGVENMDSILKVSDGIMIARGDMGVEIPLEEVPIIQKMIIKKAYGVGKHVITATQMLDSMIKNPRPTRAEATDVANAIYDGTSCIMLSGETAAGKYPIESVKTMALIAERTERDVDYKKRFFQYNEYSVPDVTNAISHATCTTAYDLDAAAIITVTQSGLTARMASRFRPDIPIMGCTPSAQTYRHLSMSWGVTPIMVDFKDNTDALFSHAVEMTKKLGLVEDGDVVVITAGVPIGIAGTTNLLKVHVVGDVLVTGQGINKLSSIGNLCVARNEQEAMNNFKQNDILVIPQTTNAILDLLKRASGIITEQGGENCHAATVGLTLDIPVIVGAKNATAILRSGTTVSVNAEKSIVSSVTSAMDIN